MNVDETKRSNHMIEDEYKYVSGGAHGEVIYHLSGRVLTGDENGTIARCFLEANDECTLRQKLRIAQVLAVMIGGFKENLSPNQLIDLAWIKRGSDHVAMITFGYDKNENIAVYVSKSGKIVDADIYRGNLERNGPYGTFFVEPKRWRKVLREMRSLELRCETKGV